MVAIWSDNPNTRITSGVIYFSAIRVGALVTSSVPMRFVTSSLSFFFLSFASVRAHHFFCFIHPSSLCWLTDMSGISVPAKNASAPTSERNNSMGSGSKGRILDINFPEYMEKSGKSKILSTRTSSEKEKTPTLSSEIRRWHWVRKTWVLLRVHILPKYRDVSTVSLSVTRRVQGR